MDRAKRFGVSLPSKLLKKFDNTISELGYTNRSKAIADAVNDFIAEKRWTKDKGEFTGTISYIYGHHQGDVTNKLTRLQHDAGDSIKSVMHAHISHDLCVEVLIVSGDSAGIRELFERIGATRGVMNAKLAVLS